MFFCVYVSGMTIPIMIQDAEGQQAGYFHALTREGIASAFNLSNGYAGLAGNL